MHAKLAAALLTNLLRRILVPSRVIAVFVVLGVATSAPASAATPERQLAFRGAVVVEPDGNGVTAATFGASSNGDVRYGLVIENGCRAGGGASPGPCPPGVGRLTVSLNEQVVFQSDRGFEVHRAALPRDAVAAAGNRLVITATGSPGAAARVAIVATR
jgi:hypothetical protein